MAISKAQQAATARYVKANYDRIEVKPEKGMKALWVAAAATAGQSVQAYVIQAVKERMQREYGPYGPQAMNNREGGADAAHEKEQR